MYAGVPVLLSLALPLSLTACGGPVAPPTDLDQAFTAASESTGVPYDVLVATSYALSRWDDRGGEANRENAVGLLALHVDAVGPTVAEAAVLTGRPADDLVDDPRANVLGGAAILAARAADAYALTGNPVDTFEEWYPLVAAYSGASDPLVAEDFARQVYDYLQWGLTDSSPSGEVLTVPAHAMPWRSEREAVSSTGAVDQYVPACSSNYSDYSRGVGDIDMIVIHTTEGSYSGAISWFQNCSAQVSAHYVVRSSDGEITQGVKDEDVAWHAGDWGTNLRSIGIEHEGYVSDPDRWYTDNMYRASAALVSRLADTYGIPKDRSHIIGHYEVPGCSGGSGGGSGCHTDPGTGWDWDYYMSLVTGSGSGSTSMGGSGLADGPRHGTFSGKVTAVRYGETDTCTGTVDGSVNNGRLYLTGTCTLVNHPDKSGNMPITWSGSADGSTFNGTMVVDGRTADFTGGVGSDGSIAADFGGAVDLGGDVGELDYSVTLSAVP